MYKHPSQYKKEDLGEIEFKPLRIYVGAANNDEVTEILEGQIVNLKPLSNKMDRIFAS